MADETREVVEGKQPQGEDESIAYTIDVSNIGNGPSVPVLTVKEEGEVSDDWTVVTTTVTSTTVGTVSSNIITLPAISGLTRDIIYRCEVAFTLGGNGLEHYFRIHAER